MDLEDVLAVLDKPATIRVLRRLMVREPIIHREFAEASRLHPQKAQGLRTTMEKLDLIRVKELPGHGEAGRKEIRLTTLGREIASHHRAVEEIAASSMVKTEKR